MTEGARVTQESPTYNRRPLIAWLAPVAAFVLLVGGGWFLIWYLRGSSVDNTLSLPDDASTALAISTASHRPQPPLSIKGKGTIARRTDGWSIAALPFKLVMRVNGGAADSVRLQVDTDAAYTGDDLKLISLVGRLMYNPYVQRRTGVSQEMIQKLRDQVGYSAFELDLPLANDGQRQVTDLWVKYITAADHTARQQTGATLLDAVRAAGQQALAANQSYLSKVAATARTLVPQDQEERFLAAEKAPPARAATRKATIAKTPAKRVAASPSAVAPTKAPAAAVATPKVQPIPAATTTPANVAATPVPKVPPSPMPIASIASPGTAVGSTTRPSPTTRPLAASTGPSPSR